jgi:hypothetical protein
MNRYAPGGDLYEALAEKYGRAAADRVWQAQESGRSGAVAEVLAELRYGKPLEESTGSLFWQQITTDPLAAPLASANAGLGTVLGSAIKGLFKNPWVLLVLVVGGAIYFWPIVGPFVKGLLKRR